MVSAPVGSCPEASVKIAAPLRDRRPESHSLDLTVLIQDADESGQLARLLPQLTSVLRRLGIAYEVCLLSHDADRLTRETAAAHDARVVDVPPDYGAALTTGFAQSAGAYLLTMDADLSQPPDFVEQLWAERGKADVTIASRFVPGGDAHMGSVRYLCSRVLNAAFSRGLDVPIRDLSSGFRLYRSAVIQEQRITSRDLDILQQIVVQAFAEGWRVQDVPFTYRPSKTSVSHRRVGWRWLKTFGELWKLRNSILAADDDSRAHDSHIPLQRYWQPQRYRHVMDLVAGEGLRFEKERYILRGELIQAYRKPASA